MLRRFVDTLPGSIPLRHFSAFSAQSRSEIIVTYAVTITFFGQQERSCLNNSRQNSGRNSKLHSPDLQTTLTFKRRYCSCPTTHQVSIVKQVIHEQNNHCYEQEVLAIALLTFCVLPLAQWLNLARLYSA